MTTVRSFLHPRDQITQTMNRIYRYRMTTTSGGNLSVRDSDGSIWISPAGIDKGNLHRNDIVCVHPDETVEGLHPPSSEYPFHRAVYRIRPDLHAIVHAHPAALVAFSICGQTPDTRLFHHVHAVCGKLGFAPYACPGSEQLGANIARTFAEGCESVVLENHGVVVGGGTLAKAFERFEAFEFVANTLIQANQLGNIRYLNDEQLQQAATRSVDFQAFEPPPATPIEQELRRQLCEILQRACRQRLLTSTEGSFSARMDADSFVITPTQKDRELLRAEDLVLVKGNQFEAGKRASRAVKAHQAIYRKHPSVQSVVFAHPINATAFSVTDSTFDVRTIPESYFLLRDVKRVPYGLQYRDVDELAKYVSTSVPAAMLENDGVVIVGHSVLDAFDRLEVLESTAEAVIKARAIGQVIAMPENVIEELKAVYHLD